MILLKIGRAKEISIPAPARGRTRHPPRRCRPPLPISIPAPARGRTKAGFEKEVWQIFQFPPPRGGEQLAKYYEYVVKYFNSRPREGANFPEHPKTNRIPISIPAPARGRTSGGCSRSTRRYISIPAPARGRTKAGFEKEVWQIFQFPPPRGGERHSAADQGRTANFNSRPREGANCPWLIPALLLPYFNSRPREGAN